MMAPLWNILTRFIAIASVAFLSPCESANGNTSEGLLSRFEVDIVFPRNETYKPSSVFPIAIAIQNFTRLPTIGNFSLIWDIMPFSDGRIPGGITYDFKHFDMEQRIDLDSGAAILIDFTDAAKWIEDKRDHGEQYMLQWYLVDYDLQDRCGYDHDGIAENGVMFSVMMEGEERQFQDYFNRSSNATVPDVLQVPECPLLGSVVNVQPNSMETTCFDFTSNENLSEGDPCAIVVNEAVASSISSRVGSIATASSSPIYGTPQPSSTNAVGAVRTPDLAGLAGAGILCGLAYL